MILFRKVHVLIKLDEFEVKLIGFVLQIYFWSVVRSNSLREFDQFDHRFEIRSDLCSVLKFEVCLLFNQIYSNLFGFQTNSELISDL